MEVLSGILTFAIATKFVESIHSGEDEDGNKYRITPACMSPPTTAREKIALLHLRTYEDPIINKKWHDEVNVMISKCSVHEEIMVR